MSDQLALALADRKTGRERNLAANEAGHRNHRTVVEAAVATLARSGTAFTADSVHRLVTHELDAPYDRNLVSSAMGTAASQGHIHRCYDRGLTPSAHRARKGSRNGWWKGNTHTPPSPRVGN